MLDFNDFAQWLTNDLNRAIDARAGEPCDEYEAGRFAGLADARDMLMALTDRTNAVIQAVTDGE